jgi:hypothetical protein
MATTLKDLLHAINILGDDRDVLVDGIDEIAVCPPVMITPEGLNHFATALGAKVKVAYCLGCHDGTYVDEDDETAQRAWELLAALAGYCKSDDFSNWFEGNTAQII